MTRDHAPAPASKLRGACGVGREDNGGRGPVGPEDPPVAGTAREKGARILFRVSHAPHLIRCSATLVAHPMVEIAARRQRPTAATRGNKSLARPVSLTASAASGDRRQAASALSSGGESRPVSHQTVSRCSRRGRLPIKVVGDTARCRPSSEDVERGGTVAGEAEAGAGGRRGAGGGEGAPGH